MKDTHYLKRLGRSLGEYNKSEMIHAVKTLGFFLYGACKTKLVMEDSIRDKKSLAILCDRDEVAVVNGLVIVTERGESFFKHHIEKNQVAVR